MTDLTPLQNVKCPRCNADALMRRFNMAGWYCPACVRVSWKPEKKEKDESSNK
jgi:hypothetical protein